ncbi:MAG: riboflavin biosynthesis protein RibF [Candidatus Marinimicrobia bacterium]|nr:riboflavin biosynthesis protein RibF [Candidatus Neomarinimicrobiota bacterium]|tara:strand:- start:4276 stop:5193 length:918 start_codon:yes stop_codon:yes gene_type:complete
MQIIDFESFKDECKTILTFGNFDGVHLGHSALINKMSTLAERNNLKSVLITFNPHTQSVLNKNNENKIITPHSYKVDLLKSYIIDYLSIINFDKNFSTIKADAFIDKILKYYNPLYILIGYDNRFGYKGEGCYDFLKDYLSDSDVEVIEFEEYYLSKGHVKSSLIKKAILEGNMKASSCFLGRDFSLYGKIVKGKGRGKLLGFPTANLKLLYKEQIIPKVGLYYVNFIDGNKSYKALCNIGYRPTFDDDKILSIESYIMEDEDFNLYNRDIKIEFLKFLRDELTFNSKEELIKQIENDIMCVKNN